MTICGLPQLDCSTAYRSSLATSIFATLMDFKLLSGDSMSLNHELSELFHNFSSLMELKGESVFKVIAFQKVGRILKELNVDLKKCIEENKLCEIEGIGKSSQQ